MPHGELRNELSMDEIPQGVIDEIKEHFKNVSFALESNIDTDTQSLRCGYTHQLNDTLITEMATMDPETFQKVMVPCHGYHNQTYIVRLNKTEDGTIVRRVVESGIVVKPAEETA